MYAIIRQGGKQFLVREGDQLLVDRLNVEEAKKVEIRDVLLASKEGNVLVGTPTLGNATVECAVVKHERGPKLIHFRMRRRKNSRRKNGHRQDLTRLQVEKIKI